MVLLVFIVLLYVHVCVTYIAHSWPVHTATQDNLVLDTPRQRRQVRRYGNDHLEGEIVDMIDPREDVIPSRGRHGWTKIELFKTEKWTLIFGWVCDH